MTGPEGERLAVLESRVGELVLGVADLRSEFKTFLADFHRESLEREKRFLSRAEYAAHHDPMVKRLDSLEARVNERLAREDERRESIADGKEAQRRVIALLGVFITLINVAVVVGLKVLGI